MPGTIYQGVLASQPYRGTIYQVEIVGGAVAMSTMTTPTKAGIIAQYTGETDETYHHGYFYESVDDDPTPSSATISQTVGEDLEDLSITKATFETQITESGTYNFNAVLNLEHITATIGESVEELRFDRDESQDTETLFAWTDGETVYFTEESAPDVADDLLDSDGETVAGAVAGYQAESIDWELDGAVVDLSDYGIEFTEGEELPAQDDVITVVYTAEQPNYKWQRINVQPSGGGGGGGVESVNSQEPDDNGNVLLNGTHIKATVDGTEATIQNHLGTLRTDVDALNVGITALETKTETLTTASKQVKTNTIYTGSTLSSVTLTFPTATATYIAKVNFKSGATATTFTVPNTVVMVNDDCSGGVFVPVANKTYSIMFHYNGTSIVGIVQGV